MMRVKWPKGEFIMIETSLNQRSMTMCGHAAIEMIYHGIACVIFVKHNYNLNTPAVANALSKWYWEIRQKEFKCKSCHKELKDGKYSKNVQNCVNSDMFESHVNDDKNNQHNVQEKRIHYENTIISDFPANYTSQSTTLTNYCLCTCCHKTDIPRSQCIIFKASKYNYDNTMIVEALSHRFSDPTSKEYSCKTMW